MKGERMLLKETAWNDSAHHPSAWRLGGRAEGPARESRESARHAGSVRGRGRK